MMAIYHRAKNMNLIVVKIDFMQKHLTENKIG